MKNYSNLINSSDLVLVEFFASWCPHCQRMMPVVAEVKADLEGKASVYQFDIDENQALAQEQGVENIPTFILYKSGQEVWRRSGEMPLEELKNAVLNFA